MDGNQDYYRILGVSRDAPEREIKRVYYELARKLHPDKAGSPEEAAKNANDLATISQAYNVLKDKKKREEYDATIRGRSAANPGGGASRPATPAPRPAPAGATPRPVAAGSAPAPAAGAAVKDESTAQPEAAVPMSRNVDVVGQKKAMAQKAFVKGMQLFKTGEYAKALSFFEVASKNDPEGEPQYHLKYAQCLMKTRGSFTKAVEAAEKAVAKEPFNVEFKLALGEVYEMAGVTSKAKDLYEEVLRWDGANDQAKLRLAMLGGKKGKQTGAAGLLNKVTDLFKKK